MTNSLSKETIQQTFDFVKSDTYTQIDADIVLYACAHSIQYKYIDDIENVPEQIIHSFVDGRLSEIIDNCPAMRTEIHVTGKSNFRYSAATIKPYKGNRANIVKPYWLDFIYKYLCSKWEATVSEGVEADDAIGISATTGNRICTIATTDKDLLAIDCEYYNIMKKTKIEKGQWLKLSANRKKIEGKGLPFFYAQMLTGDTADNIPGVGGYGPVKTCEVLQDCETEEDYINAAWFVYKDKFECDAKSRYLEVGNLLWIHTFQINDIRKYWEENYDFNLGEDV